MFSQEFLTSPLFNWVVLPLLIFLARTTDVSLGTLRHIFLARGLRNLVPVLGFFEVLIWLIAIMQIMKNLNNFACYIAWAGGFTMGNIIGIQIERRLALGMQVLRIILNKESKELIESLQAGNIGVTIIDALGSKGPVKIIFTVVERKNLDFVLQLINKYTPNAFYSIEDVREASQGVFKTRVGESSEVSYFRKLFPKHK